MEYGMKHDGVIKDFDGIEASIEESTGSLLSPLEPSVAYSIHEAALQEIAQLKSSQKESGEKIAELETEITRLKEQLLLMQQRRFGKKSEIQVGEPITIGGAISVTAHTRPRVTLVVKHWIQATYLDIKSTMIYQKMRKSALVAKIH